MKNSNKGLQNLDFVNNNHSIVYAPNSTGKTRLTKKLAKKYEKEQAMFFTSTEINSMLSFSGRKIYVGTDSNFKHDNEMIEREYNRNTFGEELLEIYDSKNASTLVKNSCLFNLVGLRRKDTFEIYSKLSDFRGDFRLSNHQLKLQEMATVDKMLSKIDLDNIKRIASENIVLLIEKNEHTISKELKDKIQSIFDSIDSSKKICPVCGHEYENNRELRDAIKTMLDEYIISSDVQDYEKCVDFLNVLDGINGYLRIDYFETKYTNEISANLLLENLSIIDNFLLSYSSSIIEMVDENVGDGLFEQYKRNKAIIEKEDSLRRSSSAFLKNVEEILNKLITLPDDFRFQAKDNKIGIVDSSEKVVDPKEFLSESEQRRMCISIVFAEIQQRGLEYIVFDDPVDSNDDYYFDISVNVIGDLIFDHTNLNWIVLTHEFRMISILADRCRTSDDAFQNDINFLFYLPDPSYHGGGIPPYELFSLDASQLQFLNEHETIIFKKIFTGVSGYQCDKDLALLASFNTTRNLYNEILNEHTIKKHELKKLISYIATGNKSYEHYKNGKKRIMRMSTLFLMNKIMYVSCSSTYSSSSKKYASNFRNSFIAHQLYRSISCENDILKYILYSMVRVMNSHYLFEKKMFEWATNKLGTLFNAGTFEGTPTLLKKLDYIKDLCTPILSNELKKYEDCFVKWRGLLNDFSHSTSRMIPPYLTINPIEMRKLEEQIQLLL